MSLDISRGVARWVIDSLAHRYGGPQVHTRIRKAHTDFEKPTPNSKSPHRIRKVHTEFERPTPNAKSPHRIRKAHTKFEKPHTEFEKPTPNSKTHTEFQNLTPNSKFNFEKLTQSVTPKLISSPLLLLFTLQTLRALGAKCDRCSLSFCMWLQLEFQYVLWKLREYPQPMCELLFPNAAQVRKFFYSCCFNRLMCRNFIKSLTLNHASHVVICVYSISLSD